MIEEVMEMGVWCVPGKGCYHFTVSEKMEYTEEVEKQVWNCG